MTQKLALNIEVSNDKEYTFIRIHTKLNDWMDAENVKFSLRKKKKKKKEFESSRKKKKKG